MAWLEKQSDLPRVMDAQRLYVLSKIQGRKQAANVRNFLTQNTTGDVYGFALAVLAAEQAGIDSEPRVQARLQEVSLQAREAYFAPAVWRSDEWTLGFPFRRVGYAAVLGHAGSNADGLDEAQAHRRAFE